MSTGDSSGGSARRLARFFAAWDEALRVGHAAERQRAVDEADDLFLLLCFSESMGLPNPVAWHTLELYPLLLEAFHDWHRRAGMQRSPLDHVRCC